MAALLSTGAPAYVTLTGDVSGTTPTPTPTPPTPPFPFPIPPFPFPSTSGRRSSSNRNNRTPTNIQRQGIEQNMVALESFATQLTTQYNAKVSAGTATAADTSAYVQQFLNISTQLSDLQQQLLYLQSYSTYTPTGTYTRPGILGSLFQPTSTVPPTPPFPVPYPPTPPFPVPYPPTPPFPYPPTPPFPYPPTPPFPYPPTPPFPVPPTPPSTLPTVFGRFFQQTPPPIPWNAQQPITMTQTQKRELFSAMESLNVTNPYITPDMNPVFMGTESFLTVSTTTIDPNNIQVTFAGAIFNNTFSGSFPMNIATLMYLGTNYLNGISGLSSSMLQSICANYGYQFSGAVPSTQDMWNLFLIVIFSYMSLAYVVLAKTGISNASGSNMSQISNEFLLIPESFQSVSNGSIPVLASVSPLDMRQVLSTGSIKGLITQLFPIGNMPSYAGSSLGVAISTALSGMV